jgi:hypothetical protein
MGSKIGRNFCRRSPPISAKIPPPHFGQNTPSILAVIPLRFRYTFTYIFALPLSHIFTGQREIEYFLIYFYYIIFQEHSTRGLSPSRARARPDRRSHHDGKIQLARRRRPLRSPSHLLSRPARPARRLPRAIASLIARSRCSRSRARVSRAFPRRPRRRARGDARLGARIARSRRSGVRAAVRPAFPAPPPPPPPSRRHSPPTF